MNDPYVIDSNAFPPGRRKSTVPVLVIGGDLELEQHVGGVDVTGDTAGYVVGNGSPAQRFVSIVGALDVEPVSGKARNTRYGRPGRAVVDANIDQEVVIKRALDVPVRCEFNLHWPRELRQVRWQIESPVCVVGVVTGHVPMEPCAR